MRPSGLRTQAQVLSDSGMIGHVQPDPWASYRCSEGLLKPEWFWSANDWQQHHTNNLRHTFRLDESTRSESCIWRALDVWVWHEQVVLFSGIWEVLDGQGRMLSKFDVAYLSSPSLPEASMGRTDLALVDPYAEEPASPVWFSRPLAEKAAPLWWRLNKDLAWASRFIAMLATSTNREYWQQIGVADELCAGIPMFSRAWTSMLQPNHTTFEVPIELPKPEWAQHDESSE